jgi:trigger factor
MTKAGGFDTTLAKAEILIHFIRERFMHVTETLNKGLQRHFTVVVPQHIVEAEATQRLVALSHKVKVTGFRPGKVPATIMKQRYGQSVLGETLENVVQKTSEQVLQERNVRPVVQPKISVTKFAENSDLEYTLEAELAPDVPEVDLKALVLSGYTIDVTEEKVAEAIKRLAEDSQQFEDLPTPRSAETGDQVTIDFLGSIDGTPFAGGKGEGFKVVLGSKQMIPGFEDGIIGKKQGEEFTLNVSFPADYGAENLAGKAADFAITLHEIKQPVAQELNDAFAKIMGVDSLEQLKEYVEDNIKKEFKTLAQDYLKAELLKAVDAAVDFELPPSFVAAELRVVQQHIEDDHVHDEHCNHDHDAPVATPALHAIAARRVKLGLVLADIGNKNAITVTDEEVRAAIFTRAFSSANPSQVLEFFQQNPRAINTIRAPLYEDKVAAFMIEQATVSLKPISEEDFYKASEAQQEDAEEEKPKAAAAPKKTKAKTEQTGE